MYMLFWNRLKVITGVGTMLVCLVGCSALQPIFSPAQKTQQALDMVSSSVGSSNLWWPLMFAGFLALLAGIINLVFLRGSAKLLVIGVLLALTPPVIQTVVASIAPWVSVLIALAGLASLSVVFGRWFGRKDIMKRAKARADYIAGNGRDILTKGQTADVLKNLDNKEFQSDYPIGK